MEIVEIFFCQLIDQDQRIRHRDTRCFRFFRRKSVAYSKRLFSVCRNSLLDFINNSERESKPLFQAASPLIIPAV
ncbi:Uncharacterised protein [Mycobacteroides abscessus subsp. abscessus]|nr:Uncharacterised protein [Mycobacteroides abscessus subsp. abscessus]